MTPQFKLTVSYSKALRAKFPEENFNPYIVSQNDEVRESLIRNQHSVSRVYALTFFNETTAEKVVSLDSIIKADVPGSNGHFLGETIESLGMSLRKNVVDVGYVGLNNYVKKEFQVTTDKAPFRFSELLVGNQSLPILYATVFEVYSPDFCEHYTLDDAQYVNPNVAVLEKADITRQVLWNVLTIENRWGELASKVHRMQKSPADRAYGLKMKVYEHTSKMHGAAIRFK